MKFRAIIEPGLGHKIKKAVLDIEADDFDAACAFINTIQSELMIRGMSTVMRLDGNEDKTGMSGTVTARTSYTAPDQDKPKRKCFDCDDGAQDCHMNCGPKGEKA
jgi:hypothetical protein